MAADPNMVEYQGRLTPEVALNKRDGLRVVMTRYADEVRRLMVWEHTDERRAALLCDSLRLELPAFEIMIWQPDIWQAASRGSQAFDGIALERTEAIRVKPQMWQWDGDAVAESDLWQLDVPCSLQACLVRPVIGMTGDHPDSTGRRGITLGYLFVPRAGTVHTLPRLRFLTPIYEGDRWQGVYSNFAAALDFTRQEIAAKTEMKLPRHVRRRRERENAPPATVTTVLLRRMSPSGQEHGDAGESNREYHWQWLVSGHWRKPSPQMKEPHPIYVRPYVKGPEGKPLKPPKSTVFLVKR